MPAHWNICLLVCLTSEVLEVCNVCFPPTDVLALFCKNALANWDYDVGDLVKEGWAENSSISLITFFFLKVRISISISNCNLHGKILNCFEAETIITTMFAGFQCS